MKYVFIIFVFAFFVSGAVAGGYYYYFLIPEKVERKFLEGIETLGLDDFAYKEIKTDSEKITLRGITLDKDGFSKIDEISIHFSLSQIFFKSEQARSIHIKGLNLTGAIEGGVEPSFDGWASHDVLLSNLKNLPAKTILIEDGSANVNSPVFGGIKAEYALQFSRNADDSFHVVGKVFSKQSRLSFHSKITGTVSATDRMFTIEAEQLSLTLPHLKVRRGAATILYNEGASDGYTADVHLGSMVWNDLPLAGVRGKVTYNNGKSSATLNGSTFGENAIPWTAYNEIVRDTHASDVRFTPHNIGSFLEFLAQTKGIKLITPPPPLIADLAPEVMVNTRTLGSTTKGNISIDFQAFEPKFIGTFSSDDGLMNINGELKLEDTLSTASILRGAHFDVPVSGRFSISRFWDTPVFSIKLQTDIKDGMLDFGALGFSQLNGAFSYDSEKFKPKNLQFSFKFPLKPFIFQSGLINFDPYNTQRNFFGTAFLKIYSGSIKTEKPLMQSGELSKVNSLVVEDINIAQLFKDAGFDDIFISGLLGGVIPLKMDENSVNVSGGILQSQNSGIIKLPPHVSALLFPGETERLQIIRKSLENYHYEFFEIRLDGDLAGRVLMTMTARGRNPELGQKDPVDLNLQIETQISSLFKNLLN